MRQFSRLGVVAFLLAATVGCGGNSYQPVRGQVVFTDNSPATALEGGQVVFRTKGGEGKVLTATGSIDAQGRFVLGTDTTNDGAAIGKYEILITPPSGSGDTPVAGIIDRKYEKFETSGLSQDVVKGENNLTLTVERASKR